ncbi:MAG: translation initiation factor IF-2 [Candidatus Sumerlaeia bacterium]|nr:translation initiation factor IF-2 [Candidatus Sumerlaeia bacterium]
MRVFELARTLGIESKDLIAELKKIKVVVKSASSSIEDKHVRKIMERLEKRKAEEAVKKQKEEVERKRKAQEEEARKKLEEEERKKREEERKREEEEERKKREEEERKRREEERKKREEEERRKREEEELRKKKEEEEKRKAAEAAKRHVPSAEKAKVIAPPPPPPPPPSPPQRKGKKREREREREQDELKPLEIIELPTIEVMKLDDPRKLYAERSRRRAKQRKRDRKGKAAEGEFETGADVATAVPPPRARRIRPSFVVPTARREAAPAPPAPPKPAEPKIVKLRGELTVGQFAEKIGVPASDVIAKLLTLGEPRTINQPIESAICELLAPEFGVQIEIIPETDEYDLRQFAVEDNPKNMVRRPPVVTIMGHVDHGKTTLLDYIRKSRVVEGEYGGITQHIGAYRVNTSRGEIVFLDTPGHEAFTSMRARGAAVTDIVVLVVAADDGVMPQTVEAIDHARAANVPIIVAINKMDLPNANPMRVRQELMRYNLVPEELGGQTIFCEVSAKTGRNVDYLLEMIALQAEMLELKADPKRRAEGIVVEARVDPQRGAIATLLVQKGTLRTGDVLVIGRQSGRIRAMSDENGRPVTEATPAHPVEVLGLGGSPEAGERFLVMPDERAAREVAAIRDDRRRQRLLGTLGQRQQVTLENLHSLVEEGKVKELYLILKADVQGSVEAICQALNRLPMEKIKIRILHAAVGPVTLSDVNLAKASDAVIIAYNVRPDTAAQELAEREGVEIKSYRIIYELLDDVQKAMTAALEPETREVALGRVEVRQTFRISRVGVVAGCYVVEGEVRRDARARLVRDGIVVFDGKIASLRRVKEDVERVPSGLECGIALANYQDIKEGDILEIYRTEVIPVKL